MTRPVCAPLNVDQSKVEASTHPKHSATTKSQLLNKIHSLPAPLRTFPLPAFSPHNPISLLYILYTWLSHKIRPQLSHITPLYQGILSSETRSVHITDIRAIRGLWEQGFYGKGSLSRSEPNWLDGEIARREKKKTLTSEELTRKRRAERQKLKWERARKERIAIDYQLLEESQINTKSGCFHVSPISREIPDNANENFSRILMSPVGPTELLSLPNSQSDLDNLTSCHHEHSLDGKKAEIYDNPHIIEDTCFKMSPQPLAPSEKSTSECYKRKPKNDIERSELEVVALSHSEKQEIGICSTDCTQLKIKEENNALHRVHTDNDSLQKYQKFEFSNQTAVPFEQPSSSEILPTIPLKLDEDYHVSAHLNQKICQPSDNIQSDKNYDISVMCEEELTAIRNEEHLQLTLEEAFFLSYALGCLQILDPVTQTPISNSILFNRFKQISPFPANHIGIKSPDSTFITNYVTYHHFRSLGWVVRSGIKFSVDYLLYNRGPVFSHAEFSVLILPSYSDPYWSSTASLLEYSRRKQHRSWAWMTCINRVISQVKKTLILCYVDIPPPLTDEEEKRISLDTILARYKIREFAIGRFLTNRMRS